MKKAAKVCPIVLRRHDNRLEVLAFVHPLAGKQFVKGTIRCGEDPQHAARRELLEESGIDAASSLIFLGTQPIGENLQSWHFFAWLASGLPDTWSHLTEDDFGHTFEFFWHPMETPLDDSWHPVFHEAFRFFASLEEEGGGLVFDG